jgi:hypothetical protein
VSGAAISSVSPVIDLVCDCRVLDLFPPAAGARRVLGDCGRPGWVGGSTGCVSGDSSRNKSSRSAFVGVFLPVLRAGGACRFGEPVPPPAGAFPDELASSFLFRVVLVPPDLH